MNTTTSTVTIKVTGEPYTITVYQEFESVWVADGEFRGERHRFGRNRCAAAKPNESSTPT